MNQPTYSSVNSEELARRLGVSTSLATAIIPVMLENLRVLDRKQQDYGSANLLKFGTFGVIVRMNDKLERIINLSKKAQAVKAEVMNGDTTVNQSRALNESLDDSFLDLANYALIAYVMSTGKWPTPEILGSQQAEDAIVGHVVDAVRRGGVSIRS